MKKFGKVVLTLIVIVVVLQVIGLVVVYFSRRIKPNTVLTVRISGDIPEQAPQDFFRDLIAGPPLTVTDIVEALDRAKTDSRITGLEMRVAGSNMNMAKIQEIRDKVREFNRAGKFTLAYLEFADNRTYFLATSAQSVYLLPKSLLYVRGMMASTTFLRGGLDKLGIYPDLYHIGQYKNASNIFTEKKFTSAHREATQTLVGDWYNEYLRGVAVARGMKPEDVQQAIEKGPFSSNEAFDARLVDRVAYFDEAREFVKKKNRGIENRLSLHDYLDRTDREARTKLAVIYATGTIVSGRSGDAYGETMMGSDTVTEQFRNARDDRSVKAVILRIDSPGGSAFASEVIRREVELTSHSKPVVVSMSDVAASGGYWIAMSANKLVAEPGTITGSIGVITGKLNIKGLFDKLGLTNDYIATTDNATLDYAFQNYSPAQRETVQRHMREIYQAFIEGVAQGRHLKVEAVDKIGQGRIWTGERAKQLGLIDELGGLDTAIAQARGLAKIPAHERVSLLYLPPRRSLLEKLSDLTGEVKGYGSALSPRAFLQRLEGLTREPVWAILPAVPEVQ